MFVKDLPFIPVTADEIKRNGWNELDVIIISGDAYVDHPAFGTAVIGRLALKNGLRVAIVPQPNWQDDLRDFKKFGNPKLFFAVTAGCMDSMVNHYTATRRLRSNDAYTAGGKRGFRPDYAVTVYCNILKKLYPEVPIVIGGIEASLRRFTHYDFWSDRLKPSRLIESKADLLIYGMGEIPFIKLLKTLKDGRNFSQIRDLEQSSFLISKEERITDFEDEHFVILNSHESCLTDKYLFADNFKKIESGLSSLTGCGFIQETFGKYLIVNPPVSPQLNDAKVCAELEFTGIPHPKYRKKGKIPAFEMISNSVTLHRGCFGGCSFCSITLHQGKFIRSKPQKLILDEVRSLTTLNSFKGTITDMGGPSANMYSMKPFHLKKCKRCKKPSCIYPQICKNLNANHDPIMKLYNKIRKISNVRHAFVSSGIRHDLLWNKDKKTITEKYLRVIINHTPGRLKIAPEHSVPDVLKFMYKPKFEIFIRFLEKYQKICKSLEKSHPIEPYLISGHPGSGYQTEKQLRKEMKKLKLSTKLVQQFTPTPMTMSSVMYYCKINPRNRQPVKCVYTKNQKDDLKNILVEGKIKRK
jgi:uncharacterized radical SAM protein YgiQ